MSILFLMSKIQTLASMVLFLTHYIPSRNSRLSTLAGGKHAELMVISLWCVTACDLNSTGGARTDFSPISTTCMTLIIFKDFLPLVVLYMLMLQGAIQWEGWD